MQQALAASMDIVRFEGSIGILGEGQSMKKFGIYVAMALGAASLAPAASAATACASFDDFLNTSCPLSWGGVQFYGTVDLGVIYQTHGVPSNRYATTGVEEMISKNSNGRHFGLAPNG